MKNNTFKKFKGHEAVCLCGSLSEADRSGRQIRLHVLPWTSHAAGCAEYDFRHNNNIRRLIKNAKFSDSSAFLGNIE